jgi:hypothetical protein
MVTTAAAPEPPSVWGALVKCGALTNLGGSSSQDGLRVVLSAPATTLTSLSSSVQLLVTCVETADGTESDCTDEALFACSDTHVAEISPGSLVTPVTNGEVVLTARVDSVDSNVQELAVELGPICTELRLSGRPSLAAGTSAQLAARCDFDDGRISVDVGDQVTWLSDSESIATVSESGLVQGQSDGVTTISASLDSTASNAVQLVIGPPLLDAISIGPATTAIDIDQGRRLPATCTLSDGSFNDCSWDVTWSSSREAVLGIDTNGTIMGLGVGISAVTASLDGVDSNNLTVTVSIPSDCLGALDFPDPVLRQEIDVLLGLDPTDTRSLYYEDIDQITRFAVSGNYGYLEELTGLRCLTALGEFFMTRQRVTSISDAGRPTTTYQHRASDERDHEHPDACTPHPAHRPEPHQQQHH